MLEMHHLQHFIYYLLHIDTYILSVISLYGSWSYLLLFLIIFCETGLVICPFLPGDSLLFVSGSVAAQFDSALSVSLLFIILTIASTLGNQFNYFLGKLIGLKLLTNNLSVKNQKYLDRTHAFYAKYGGKTIILARFIPVIRTLAPFVAGVGAMKFHHFLLYNLLSAMIWISSLLYLGYFIGTIPFIKNNFTLVIYIIIVLSLLPTLISILRQKIRL